jgi:hypothetical protein
VDDRKFDWLAKGLAEGRSRRSLIKTLFGIGAGMAAGAGALGATDAARRGFSGPTVPKPTATVPPVPPTPVPPTPTPEPAVGCASGSTACGSDCCVDGTSMCCDGACCVGYCYGEELCCPTPRDYCAENNTCCPAGEKCCLNGYCYSTANGQCCQDDECPNGGKCCDPGQCFDGPNACCSDDDCPSGHVCTQDNTCCATTCVAGTCGNDGCEGFCPCPDGYACLPNGTCAIRCAAGSLFCEQQACGSCWVDADSSDAYCGAGERGVACGNDGECPTGQFCTLLDPPSHCVTACRT